MADRLPSEIVLQIALWTTPSSFISLSQTCQFYRSSLGPIEKYHLIHRLLDLEMTEWPGGGLLPTPDAELFDWGYSGVAAVHYTCVGCMKLLQWTRFDRTMMFQRGWAKPTTFCEVVSLANPGNGRTRARRNHLELNSYFQVRLTSFWRLVRTSTSTQDSPRSIWPECESIKDGKLRGLRMCIECRYQRGDYRPSGLRSTYNPGSWTSPVVRQARASDSPRGIRIARCAVCNVWCHLPRTMLCGAQDPVGKVWPEEWRNGREGPNPWPEKWICPDCQKQDSAGVDDLNLLHRY